MEVPAVRRNSSHASWERAFGHSKGQEQRGGSQSATRGKYREFHDQRHGLSPLTSASKGKPRLLSGK
jgi:hypothetical protein